MLSWARRIPAALIVFRAIAGLTMPVLALSGGPRYAIICAVILGLGVLSDIFDGIIARRLGVATEQLRLFDSRVDVLFWAGAVVGAHLMHPGLIARTWPLIAVILVLEAVNHLVSHIRFGREASPHHYASKLFGLVLWALLTALFLNGKGDALLILALAVGVYSQLEAMAITLTLRSWRCDVPSVWQARRQAHSEASTP